MRQLTAGLILLALTALSTRADSGSPFAGRWDFNVSTPAGMRAAWLGVTEKNGTLDIWFQPTGGNVYQVRDFEVNGSHLKLNLAAAHGDHPALIWD
ncbi:MAG: hypothetical protein JO319_19345, partial [Acidobacteriaceae bacterium]|nr:hypothetical protein [Acidobacteriaceae bacterium]